MVDELSFLDAARAWVASGHDINRFVDLDGIHDSPVRIEYEQGPWRQTLLHFASRSGWCGAMRWLLNQGARVQGTLVENSDTPLHVAAHDGREDAAVLLLNAGAQFDAKGQFSMTPLHNAARFGHTRLCKLLLSRGSSLDAIMTLHYYDATFSYVTGMDFVDPEAAARQLAEDPSNHRYLDAAAREAIARTADLLAEVRAAGGWNMYVAAPRQELLAFRRELPTLHRRGPSSAPIHERLFLEIPEDVFIHVVSFWRTPRDYQPE